MIASFRHAVAFLTRLPGGSHPQGQVDIARSVPYFPIVGLLVGALGAVSFAAGSVLLTPSIGAILSLTVTAAVTGALHEDGLADSMDALAGGWDREQRMEIFKDSRHGTFGVLSLILVTLLKFVALTSIADLTSDSVDVALGGLVAGELGVSAELLVQAQIILAAHAIARSVAVVAMAVLPSARAEGLAATYGKSLPLAPSAIAGLIGLVVAGLVFGVWTPVVLGAVGASTVAISVWAMKKIGGATGDILGAVEQAVECAVLLTAVAILSA